MPVASAESAPNSPCESGGPRKRTRRLVRLRSIATSIGSTLVFTFSTAAPIATKLMMRRCSGADLQV
ncbi:Uncharacterised protein [Mycobacterium tuberculosis]|uniref:Uncharacterized protein n=1 Tax=Mycobacterium tuberculosis TaxID=1773 RepID=A0A916LF43_MYCTX|nr:Uncharacterised protein [Mycobacterium tuberculosis]